MLFLVIALGSVEGHAGHGADGAADLVLPHGEHGVIEMGAPAPQGMKGPAVHHGDGAVDLVDLAHVLGPFLPDEPQIAAGNHRPLSVNHANDAVGGFLDLQDNILKNSS